jgi:hypothetical protein
MIMFKRARDLSVGDVFSLQVYGEVVAVASVADGKRMKVRISLEDQGGQGARSYRDSHDHIVEAILDPKERAPFGHDVRKGTLEFTDAGYVLEFLSPPGRKFHVIEWRDDDDGADEDPVDVGPLPSPVEPVEG